jgi:hypothetical protein
MSKRILTSTFTAAALGLGACGYDKQDYNEANADYGADYNAEGANYSGNGAAYDNVADNYSNEVGNMDNAAEGYETNDATANNAL